MGTIKTLAVLAIGSAVLLGLTFANQSPSTDAPDPVPGSGGLTWVDVQDLGKGVSMRTFSGLTDLVTDAAGNRVRPVALNIEFLYGQGMMSEFHNTLLPGATDASPFVNAITVSRQLIDPIDPAHDVLKFEVSVTPKLGFTWGTIRGTVDLDIVAFEQ